jgi:hypothetical protein
MPIVPAFDPATGASGGPQGGGGGAGGLRLLGDLSGATFTDSQSMLTSYSYDPATGIHAFVVPDIPTPNLDMVQSSGNNFSGPKWNIPLLYDDGTPANWDDAFTMTIVFDRNWLPTAPTCPELYLLYVGVINNPTSTSLISMGGTGAVIGKANKGSTSMNAGCWKRNNANILSLSNGCISASTTFSFSGKNGVNNQCGGQATATRRLIDGLPIGITRSNGDMNVADGSQVTLSVWLSLATSSLAAIGGTITSRVRISAQKLEMIP